MNYQLTLSDSDRQELARAFGKFVTALTNAAPILDEKSGTDRASAPSPHATPAAVPAMIPIERRDRRPTRIPSTIDLLVMMRIVYNERSCGVLPLTEVKELLAKGDEMETLRIL